MSTEAVTWAMDDAPMLLTDKGKPDTTARHVLQALSEHASKTGTNAYPSITRLQYRTGYDRRTVQRALRRLEAAEIISAAGDNGGRTIWTLAMQLKRPESDWSEIEQQEQRQKEATAARVRRHREKRVTPSAPVTETHADDVTDIDVTHSPSVRNGVEQRYVTHSASVRNARNAAQTTNEPTTEPPVEKDSPPEAETDPAGTWSDYANSAPAAAALSFDEDDWTDPFDTHTAPQQAAAKIPGADQFDTFWAAYPKRIAKQDARKAWVKALKGDTTADHIIAAATRFAEERTGQDPRFTPYPATWLNRGSYDDEPPTPGANIVQLRPNGHQQQTDDLFDRAMARARARMQQESS